MNLGTVQYYMYSVLSPSKNWISAIEVMVSLTLTFTKSIVGCSFRYNIHSFVVTQYNAGYVHIQVHVHYMYTVQYTMYMYMHNKHSLPYPS